MSKQYITLKSAYSGILWDMNIFLFQKGT